MGGSTSTTNTTSNQVNQIPQWMSDAGQQNYALAQQIAQQPLQQYQGQMVADVGPQMQQSWDTAANSGNVGSEQFNAATAGYLGALSQTPDSVSAGGPTMTVNAGGPTMQVNAGGPTMQVSNPGNAAAVTAGNIGDTDLSRYMDPYTSQVINSTIPIMEQQNALTQIQGSNAANSANAFGGSRQGIQQGVAQAQGAQNIGQMIAQLQQANFGQAQAAATGDINRQLQAGTTNQASQQTDLNRANTDTLANQSANAADLNRSLSAQTANQSANAADLNRSLTAQTSNQSANAADLQRALTAAGMNQTAEQAKINSDIVASQGLTNTGDSLNKANVANFNMQQSAGAAEQMQAQNQINAQMAKFNQAFNYPQQQLGVLESSLGMTPHDTSTSGQSSTATTTPTDWASIISKGAGAAADIYGMSDETMKTDITKLGKDPKTGLEMHAFRYKDDPKTYPKVVGPMAQDVEEKYPGSTKPMGSKGKLAIRMNARPPIPMGGQHIPTPQGFAAGTASVGQPSLAGFMPPSSPGVAKAISSMSAFVPKVRMPRGAGVPKMPPTQRFAFGTADVPDMNDVALGDQIAGGDMFGDSARAATADKIRKLGADVGGGTSAGGKAPTPSPIAQGWAGPSMGYFRPAMPAASPRCLVRARPTRSRPCSLPARRS